MRPWNYDKITAVLVTNDGRFYEFHIRNLIDYYVYLKLTSYNVLILRERACNIMLMLVLQSLYDDDVNDVNL